MRKGAQQAHGIRMEGVCRIADAGPKRLHVHALPEGAHVVVWMDGEKLVDTVYDPGKPVPSGELFGVAGLHRMRIECRHPTSAIGIPSVTLEPVSERTGEPLEFYALLPLATIEYRIGDGEWETYAKPFAWPPGQVLHVKSRDDAGNTFAKIFELQGLGSEKDN